MSAFRTPRLPALLLAALLAGLAAWAAPARAMAIRDLVSIEGVRSNQLVGYGLVVGLSGTGDQATQVPYTTQSLLNMFQRLGINLPASVAQNLQPKDLAAVMVTADLPAFSLPGQKINVTVSAVGNSSSLAGGTLLMTPLKGADGQTYAVAQGSIVVSGYGASSGGTSTQVNFLTAGTVANGATVERKVPDAFDQGPTLTLALDTPSFGTASRIADRINESFGANTAVALNAGNIQVQAPGAPGARTAFLGRMQALDVSPSEPPAKVVIDARSGTVVLGQNVTLGACAVAHGNLSVSINTQYEVSQPNPLGAGQTTVVPKTSVKAKSGKADLLMFRPGVTLDAVVRALNAVGASPQDLIAIVQAMKQAGALHAQLDVI
ncbi:MAG: flagellar basal body P-ring protein FlgI [Betaproteobacteria bacterium]|nr:flagellar basal body P-ring protein FlgI [Betaproteobacteria bacterium]MBU6512132.1 flagellar basal body P-ring protein FlgI [Betaproteobacteria bacterium]MDE1954644.1 flagellar basal body P-ring protein FlgI [Betaproteobacteria bacterium]MDE2152419.1 flagellar basal body P-ring protein FlgI [Betaproteobacteria bacterium]MDE2479676.1 flagellar basal body P-ring protein FlgI [Betaproteobacteria bacterium]